MPRLRVAVAGGGIGGMAAALCLALKGHEVSVHEKAPALAEVGAGLQIGPNGVKVLDRLGLGEALRARASAPEAVAMLDGPGGREVARVPLGATALARHGAPYLQLHRADLLDLLAGAARQAGARLELGSEILPEAPPEGDVLVAADGIRSAFRARLVPGVAPAFTGQTAFRALVPADAAPPSFPPALTRLYMGPGRHLVVYPLRGGSLWNIVAVRERGGWTEEDWHLPADPTRLRDAFAGWAPEVGRMLDAVGEVQLWGLFAHGALPRWQDGRVALLGDACHPMLPFLAQGATMAIEDAWVLADELGRSPVPEALAAYEARRKPRTARVQRAAARNARVYHLGPKSLRAIRDIGLAGAARLAPGGLLGRFDWLYGHDVTRG